MPTLPHVKEIASVGHYTPDGPPKWVDQWRHNEMWFFDSEALVRKVLADAIQIEIEPDQQHDPPWRIKLSREAGGRYHFFAYKLFPWCFVEGRREDFVLPPLNCEPLPADYEPLGYDAVNRTGCAHFECSPAHGSGI